MVGTNLMRGWTGTVESAALVAIVILAIGLMVRAVKPSEVARHLGSILFITILLLVPAIMVNTWSAMSYWQQLGIVLLVIMIGLLLRALRQTRKRR
jgi:putative effector of murein hydrolase LrgA (UPF0299 family)